MHKCIEKIKNLDSFMNLKKDDCILTTKEHFVPGNFIQGEPVRISEIVEKEFFFEINSRNTNIYLVNDKDE